jgi:hypothetical protein
MAGIHTQVPALIPWNYMSDTLTTEQTQSWQTITILASPQVNLGGNRTICAGDSTTFDAGACSGCTYQWKNLGTGLIVGQVRLIKQAWLILIVLLSQIQIIAADQIRFTFYQCRAFGYQQPAF